MRLRCVDGIEADAARARELLDRSTATATALSPFIGYEKTAELAKKAVLTGRSVRQLALEQGLLDEKQIDDILSVEAMTRPGERQVGQVGQADKVGRLVGRKTGWIALDSGQRSITATPGDQ